MEAVRCSLDDTAAEDAYLAFRETVCGGKSRRYAMLYYGSDGVRCKLENSGRCLDADTPWRMVRFLVEPMFRFDPGMEWVALFPAENWRQRCDAALNASLETGRSWTRILADRLADELDEIPRLVITR